MYCDVAGEPIKIRANMALGSAQSCSLLRVFLLLLLRDPHLLMLLAASAALQSDTFKDSMGSWFALSTDSGVSE